MTAYASRWGGPAALAAALLAPLAATAASCTVSATALAFGSYSPLSATPADANGSITLTCAPVLVAFSLAYSITLSSGSQGSYAPRLMMSGAQPLQYQLYTDVLRSTPWGDGSGGTSAVAGNIPLILIFPASVSHTGYGRVPALQSSAAAGTYADLITVTVTY